MKLLIDIPEGTYTCCKIWANSSTCTTSIKSAIANGVILPEGHGDLIDREEFLKTFLDSFWGAVKEGNSSFEVVGVVKNIIRNAPIVIEADQENKE